MPSSTLPPLIMTSEKGSFARQTIEELKANIIDRILVDYDYPSQICEALLLLKSDLTQGTIQYLQEATSDKSLWDEDAQPWLGKSWLDIPWLFAETYFYRKVLEATQYFQPGPWMDQDPYRKMKTGEIINALPYFISEYNSMGYADNFEDFSKAMAQALWGNRADLSNLQHYETGMDPQMDRIIRDDGEAVYQLLKNQPADIAYLFDNVGREFYFDLAFNHYLIKSGLAKSITFYLKNQPFFVSDAMPTDLQIVLDLLETAESEKVRLLAADLISWMKSGTITIEAPPFLATSRDYRHLPESLRAQIAAFDITFLKGDANYRRLIGDCHWSPTTTLEEAAGYFPNSFVSLRTLKAELIVGLTEQQLEDFQDHAEPNWMFNGKRGMISFWEKAKA